MTTNHLSHAKNRPFRSFALLLIAMFICAADGLAAPLTWDAGNMTNGTTIDSASGAWNTDTSTNFDWNDGTTNVSWTQGSTTSPLNGAIFSGPDAPDGTYQVAVNGGQVAATNLTINASGYVFSGSPIFLNGNASKNNFFIADGKKVVISNNITGSGACEYLLGGSGAPSSVTILGNVTGFTPTISSTNGSILYLAGTNSASIGNFLADVRQTNGAYNSSSAFVIGRNGGSLTEPSNATGSFTVDGPTTVVNHTSDYIYLGRQLGTGNTPWNATFTIQNGATVNYQIGANNNNLGLALPRVGSSGVNCISRVLMNGGTLNMGPGTENPQLARPIFLANGGSSAGQSCLLIQSGGVINAWSGIQIGGTGTYNGGTAAYTNSGGILYLGSIGGGGGIRFGASVPPTNRVSLSGGTMGALQNWNSSVPMILDGNHGNFTFQCADSNGNSLNIGLSGNLTGPGGLNKTGGGVLTLSGTNNYAGSTAVSNGTLVVPNLFSPTNGDLIVDGGTVSAGLPNVSNIVSVAGQSWTSGNLSFTSGQPTLSFNFGGLPPSTTVAPIQLTGNLAFTVTPSVVVGGIALSVGDYPLIHYAGGISGTPPTIPSVPSNVGATISNNAAAHTLVLHVTNGPVSSLTWAVGNGTWDIGASLDWKQNGNPTTYQDGDSVQFDNTSSGTSPITVTLNSTVNPANVQVTGAKSYIISGAIPGAGDITGPNGVNVTGGTLTLSNANTYTGGTTVSAPGQLNINYGGDGGGDSAIGTGTLTLNTGAKLDNTSGHAIVLNPGETPIPINWNDDWTFLGTSNLDLGLGQVTLGNVEVVVTVVSNTLIVNNPITDNGQVFKLTKQGSGTLTLSNSANNFSGGLDLENGTLNLNADSAGQGTLNIGGGVLDNTSGADVTLTTPSKLDMLANFTFNGTGNLNLGTAATTIGGQTITLNGTGALETDGAFLGGNRATTVTGTGQWIIGGFQNNSGLGLTINGGTVYFGKSGGNAIGGGNTIAVNTGGTLVMMNPTSAQIGTTSPVTLTGGTMDMNGDSEIVASLAFNNGVLKNSADNTTSSLSTGTNTITLTGTNCVFDVDGVNGILTLPSVISGTGSLIKTGAGALDLSTAETYTGNTTLSNGTIALQGAASLASPSIVLAATNALLDASAVTDTNGNPTAEVTLLPNQTLSGVGSINGGLVAPTGSTVMPGTPTAVGTLTVTNNVTLSGNLLVGISRPSSSSQLVSATGTITYGGTLSLTNIGPALHVGDTFQLFPSAVTTFAGINLPTTDASGNTYTWNNNVASAGSVTVASVTSAINPNPGKILFGVSGATLSLSWPTNGGWILQTNAGSLANTNAWYPYPGSTNLTNVNINISQSQTNVFFRLVYP